MSILGVKFQLSSSQFQLAGLSSHVEFELMPSFRHMDTRRRACTITLPTTPQR